LGSRHHSLDLSELMDVTDLLRAFEQQNTVRISLRFGVVEHQRAPTLGLVGEAWAKGGESMEARPLASVSVICSDLGLKTWNAVLTQVLYMLDFQLALNEFESEAP